MNPDGGGGGGTAISGGHDIWDLLIGRGYLWYYCYPTPRTVFNVRVVALRILAEVPVVGLLLLRLAICWGASVSSWIVGLQLLWLTICWRCCSYL